MFAFGVGAYISLKAKQHLTRMLESNNGERTLLLSLNNSGLGPMEL